MYSSSEVVSLIQKGGKDRDTALKSVYVNNELRKSVTKIILKLGGSAVDADDFFNEALIVFDRNIRSGKFEFKSNIETYYVSIAKFLFLNQQRKDKRQKVTNTDLNGTELRDESKHVQEQMEGEEKVNELKRIISQANETCKRLFTMYMQRWSYEEMAEEMGHSNANSSKNALYRCREKLRAALRNKRANKLKPVKCQ